MKQPSPPPLSGIQSNYRLPAADCRHLISVPPRLGTAEKEFSFSPESHVRKFLILYNAYNRKGETYDDKLKIRKLHGGGEMNLIPIRDELKEAVELKLMGQVQLLDKLSSKPTVTASELLEMMTEKFKEKTVQVEIEKLPRMKVNSKELAKIYGVKLRQIQDWAKKKMISRYIPPTTDKDKLGRKVVLYDVAKVEKQLEKWEIKAIGQID